MSLGAAQAYSYSAVDVSVSHVEDIDQTNCSISVGEFQRIVPRKYLAPVHQQFLARASLGASMLV